MGLLINDELIWISIPRCASVSIESALFESNLNIKKLPKDGAYQDAHMHFQKSELYKYFGIHKTISIKRDWFNRWLSGLYQLFKVLNKTEIYTPIIAWEDIDNDFIYKTFDTQFANLLYAANIDNWDSIFLRLIKENKVHTTIYDDNGYVVPNIIGTLSVFLSQNYYKENTPTDYEFDLSEIDKFSDFIYNRFGERLDIKKLNERTHIPNKIIVDDELKKWIWDKFEKPFEKKKILI